MRHPILLFDGDCNFCRASVHWLLKHDPEGVLRFAPLESEVGKKLLLQHGVVPTKVESVVLLDDGQVFLKSEAIFEAVKHLRSRWRVARGLRIFPRFLRDFGYELVSQNRPVISRTVGTIDKRYEPRGPERDRFLAT